MTQEPIENAFRIAILSDADYTVNCKAITPIRLKEQFYSNELKGYGHTTKIIVSRSLIQRCPYYHRFF